MFAADDNVQLCFRLMRCHVIIRRRAIVSLSEKSIGCCRVSRGHIRVSLTTLIWRRYGCIGLLHEQRKGSAVFICTIALAVSDGNTVHMFNGCKQL